MSVATLRQKPPPMAGPLMAPMTGWCMLADGPDDVVEELHGALCDGGAGQAGDVGDDAGVLEVGSRAERPARPGEDHHAGVVVGARGLQRLDGRGS